MLTPLERAFELAKSGKCSSIAEILRVLRAEGHRTAQIEGPALRKQLRGFIAEARARLDQ
ncbi:MAG TPA: hypothetical protein PKE16_18300 [Hyphomicrobium sp.]|nr:hypothetical protein [Hyphomicrobium sp.]